MCFTGFLYSLKQTIIYDNVDVNVHVLFGNDKKLNFHAYKGAGVSTARYH